jgi:hypothetical protein
LCIESLFACFPRKSNSNSVEVYAAFLASVPEELLVVGLSEAFATTREWLTPGQIRELCTGMTAADELAAAVDEGWAFAMDYLRKHGATGRPRTGKWLNEDKPWEEAEYAPSTPAPEIPEHIAQALATLGDGDVVRGLTKIGATEADQMHFVKKDFGSALQRALRMGGL